MLPRIRASTGERCEDLRAEITAWTSWCVERCDENGTDLVAVRAAMAECSAWCSERGCPTASFLPPEDGCARYACFEDSATCPTDRCPWSEHCSLIDARRVWNCYCRDLVTP